MKIASKIQKNLVVTNRSNTDMLVLSYLSTFAKESQIILNELVHVYLDLDREWNSVQAGNLVFINEQLSVQQQKLRDAEENFKIFKEKEKIFDIDANASLILESLVSSETNYLNTIAELNINKEEYNNLKSKLSEEEKTLSDKLVNDMNVQVITIISSITDLEAQLVKNEAQYGKAHELVKNIKNKIDVLKKQLNEKTKNLIEQGIVVDNPLNFRQEIISKIISLETNMIVLEARSKEYYNVYENFDKKLDNLPRKQLEYARYNRAYSVLSENYTFLLQKLEEAKMNVASESGKVQIIDLAVIPGRPLKPNHRNDIIFGFLLGLTIAVSSIIALDSLNNTIKNVNDLEKRRLTIIGIIPSIKDDDQPRQGIFSNLLKRYSLLPNSNKIVVRHLITHEDPKSPISEAYRTLRTNLIYSRTDDKKIKSILVSSSGPGEGKTTTVSNLAITYANLGKRTLLIDTDLRRPVIHKVFNCEKDRGISSYLTGHEDDFNSLVQKTDIDNLFVVSSGIVPPNPSELLGSEKMVRLVAKLEREWDMVLFDSPPLVAVTDATMVSKEIDSIIIVVKSDRD